MLKPQPRPIKSEKCPRVPDAFLCRSCIRFAKLREHGTKEKKRGEPKSIYHTPEGNGSILRWSWSVAVGKVVVSLSSEYSSARIVKWGWLKYALCWRGLTIFSKISYSVYLTQFLGFFYNVGTTRTSQEFNAFTSVVNLLEFIFVLFISTIMTLLFDLPMQEVKNVLMKSKYSVYLTQFLGFFYDVGTTRTSQEFNAFTSVVNLLEFIFVLFISTIMTLLFDLPMQEVKNVLMKSIVGNSLQPTSLMYELLLHRRSAVDYDGDEN
uniref:Uncharacterized protein n=1 Tax=Timema cristinae TaxID=61476 RepID=A0A7R9H662_TIMCR|nr:unnamed protein product [Timema cristinae]